MTKAEMIAKIAADAQITKTTAEAALKAFTEGVVEALNDSTGKLTLTGFGTFTKTQRKARRGINPQTGKTIHIPARNVVKFKPGKKLRESV